LIGVFDSGIGGQSVLRALRAQLPHEQFHYIADTEHAPYGERDDAFVAQRAMAITRELVEEHRAALVVVACNTATAAAIHLLREEFPRVPIVGIEPALKPALEVTKTGHIGVLATRTTLASAKFAALLASCESLSAQTQFILQACDGLAQAIETNDALLVRELFGKYWDAIRARGDVDALVLGCTHYPLADDVLREVVGPRVTLVEPGPAVARRVAQLLD